MIQLKPFTLKLLYFAVGITPLILLAIISQQDLEKSPVNLLWFGLFGAVLIASILVQKKLKNMGVVNLKEIGTYVAFTVVILITYFIIRQIV